MRVDTIASPLGEIAVIVDDAERLRAVVFLEDNPRLAHWLTDDLVPAKNPAGVTSRLARYFAGDVHALDDIVIHTEGTPFQEEVWRALRSIGPGERWTYAELAAQIGRPDAVRAVGHANGRNPLNLVVPCHRVVASNGALTGYGGGIARKEWLLAHEAHEAHEAKGTRPAEAKAPRRGR